MDGAMKPAVANVTLALVASSFSVSAPCEASIAQPSVPAAVPTNTAPSAARSGRSAEDKDIIVVGQGTQTSIDRTSYVVNDTSEARSLNALELLTQVPALEVTSGGQVRIVGRRGTTITVDGLEIRDPSLVLQALQGSQIARIEVISNPSARFSATGTGGIINIVLRKSAAAGIKGSLAVTAGSYGSYNLRASPTVTKGKVTISGGAAIDRTESRSKFSSALTLVEPDAGTRLERGEQRDANDSRSLNINAIYSPTDARVLTVTGLLLRANGIGQQASLLRDVLDDGGARVGTRTSDSLITEFGGSMRFGADEKKSTLTITGKYSLVDSDLSASYLTTSIGPTSSFVSENSGSNHVWSASVDYVQSKSGRINIGSAFQFASEQQRLSVASGEESQKVRLNYSIAGEWSEYALYATYQFGFLGGKLLPGLRLEQRKYEIGSEPSQRSYRYFFPSLHLERPISKQITAYLSYSRRIAWVSIVDLDPNLRYSDPTTASVGNSLLRPELTDSFEGKLSARVSSNKIEVAGFHRKTRNLKATMVDVTEDNTVILKPYNSGVIKYYGLSAVTAGPILPRLRYTMNLVWTKQDSDEHALPLPYQVSGSQISGSGTIEYREGQQGKTNSDRIQLQVRYTGQTDVAATRISSTYAMSLSWAHTYSERLSSVLTLSDIPSPPRIRVSSRSNDLVFDQTSQSRGPRVKFSLVWKMPERN